MRPISAGQARYLVYDAHIIPMVLGSRSEPVDVGRSSYTVPTGMRRALVARDGGCAFPQCSRTAASCDSHHVTPWSAGGSTSLANLVLLCPRHHRLVHASQWEVDIANGRPEFYPPPFIDPNRAPRRNTFHRRPDQPNPPP